MVAHAGTGSAPFAGSAVLEILYRVAHEPPALDGLDAGDQGLTSPSVTASPGR
ncbi:hypothetical protein [Actinomadura oligospora]|uniref:hypothetical protein n=1 Tax=Actinomadura oligospora TaxID=111804 RepID=UPI0004AF79B9|nr:hypothetical protein [Actinomadura oligospora]